mgnify:CR=1 FL=1
MCRAIIIQPETSILFLSGNSGWPSQLEDCPQLQLLYGSTKYHLQLQLSLVDVHFHLAFVVAFCSMSYCSSLLGSNIYMSFPWGSHLKLFLPSLLTYPHSLRVLRVQYLSYSCMCLCSPVLPS